MATTDTSPGAQHVKKCNKMRGLDLNSRMLSSQHIGQSRASLSSLIASKRWLDSASPAPRVTSSMRHASTSQREWRHAVETNRFLRRESCLRQRKLVKKIRGLALDEWTQWGSKEERLRETKAAPSTKPDENLAYVKIWIWISWIFPFLLIKFW